MRPRPIGLGVWRVLKQTATKFSEVNGPFLASGLAFDLLLYSIPFSLLIISAMGYTAVGSDRALAEVQAVLQRLLPQALQYSTENLTFIVANRGLLGIVGFFLFFLLSSVTFGSVRIVLNTVFEARRRSYLKGKGMDFLMMLAASGLLLLTVGISIVFGILGSLGERLTVVGPLLHQALLLASGLLAFMSIMALFYVLYRFSPAQTLGQRALVSASLLGASLFALSKWAFTWFVSVAQANTALYGTLGGLLFFFLWLYYASLVFILSATVGWVLDHGGRPPAEQPIART